MKTVWFCKLETIKNLIFDLYFLMKPKLRLNIETKVQNFKKTNFKNFKLYFM